MNESLEKHVAEEWERILGPHPHPSALGGWQMRAEAIVKERDALKSELAKANEALQKDWQKTCIHHTDDQRAIAGCPVCTHRELASVRAGAAQLAEELGACKRERDAIDECYGLSEKDLDLERERTAALQQQLTEQSALCERLKAIIQDASNEFAMIEHKFERAGGPFTVAHQGVQMGANSWASNVENGLNNTRLALQRAEGKE